MKRPHASRDVRERALAALDGGRSVGEVAACVRVDPATVRRWRRHRARDGTVGPRPRSGRPRRLSPADHAALRDQVVATPDATLATLCDQWEQAHGVRVSASTMRRALVRLGITLKKRP